MVVEACGGLWWVVEGCGGLSCGGSQCWAPCPSSDSWILDPRSNPAATKIQAQQRGFVARQRAKRMQKANFRQKQVAHQETVKRTEELREQAEMFAAEAHSVYNDITITHDMRTVEHRETEQRQFLLASERRDWRALQQQDISGQMMRVLPEASASLAPEIHEEQRLKAQGVRTCVAWGMAGLLQRVPQSLKPH